MAFLDKYKSLMIQLQDIKSATNNFTATSIGGGGFGRVYKGEMSRFKDRGLVAFKRLDATSDQGEAEFWKEITTLSDYKHDNLISLLGFCYEGREKILIYEYASNGSLDCHLSSANVTWRQRLKICLQAARALEYLHDPKTGTHERVIHCDIKSSNILLDGEWNAKLSDFGLSKMAIASQAKSFVISAVVGTHGYIDPLYATMDLLTKESDVYSFGVVLFEVLSGRLCYDIINGYVQPIVDTWKESYEQNKLNEMVFRDLIIPIDQVAFKTYTEIAYRCVETFREKRPTMTEVVMELDYALNSQEISEWKELELIDYEELAKTTEPPLKYRAKAELMILLSKGVLFNDGDTWFSLTKNEEHCEMISLAACLRTKPGKHHWSSEYNSKFEIGSYKSTGNSKYMSKLNSYESANRGRAIVNGLKYKLDWETKTSMSCHANAREDGWLTLELYQFTSDRNVNLGILFSGYDGFISPDIQVDGIELRPLEITEHKMSDDGKKDVETISDDSDVNWEEKLPADYEDIIKQSMDSLQWTTKKELYSLFCNGFLVNGGEEWFFLHKHGKRCQMLSARAACKLDHFANWLSLPKSRFGEAYNLSYPVLGLVYKIKSQALSSETRYACYLVYKFPQNQSSFGTPVKVTYRNSSLDDWEEADSLYIYLVTPQTPVIRPKTGENTHKPLSRPKLKGLPEERSDGWMEVQLREFRTGTNTQVIPMMFHLEHFGRNSLQGLIVQGIEFRPI